MSGISKALVHKCVYLRLRPVYIYAQLRCIFEIKISIVHDMTIRQASSIIKLSVLLSWIIETWVTDLLCMN